MNKDDYQTHVTTFIDRVKNNELTVDISITPSAGTYWYLPVLITKEGKDVTRAEIDKLNEELIAKGEEPILLIYRT